MLGVGTVPWAAAKSFFECHRDSQPFLFAKGFIQHKKEMHWVWCWYQMGDALNAVLILAGQNRNFDLFYLMGCSPHRRSFLLTTLACHPTLLLFLTLRVFRTSQFLSFVASWAPPFSLTLYESFGLGPQNVLALLWYPQCVDVCVCEPNTIPCYWSMTNDCSFFGPFCVFLGFLAQCSDGLFCVPAC